MGGLWVCGQPNNVCPHTPQPLLLLTLHPGPILETDPFLTPRMVFSWLPLCPGWQIIRVGVLRYIGVLWHVFDLHCGRELTYAHHLDWHRIKAGDLLILVVDRDMPIQMLMESHTGSGIATLFWPRRYLQYVPRKGYRIIVGHCALVCETEALLEALEARFGAKG